MHVHVHEFSIGLLVHVQVFVMERVFYVFFFFFVCTSQTQYMPHTCIYTCTFSSTNWLNVIVFHRFCVYKNYDTHIL